MTVQEAKSRVGDIWNLAHLLNWPLTPGCTLDLAFWRGNVDTPALSITPDGRGWCDHATGKSGDMVDLLAEVTGSSVGDACRRLTELAESLGSGALQPAPRPPVRTREEKRASWPVVFGRLGTDELFALAHMRHLPHFAGVCAAAERGTLVAAVGFEKGEPWPIPAWGLTDSAREAVQIRRRDGKPWSVGKSKSMSGSLGGWPIGSAEIGERADVILTEGEPDYLAAITLCTLLNPHPATQLPRDPGTWGFACMVGAAKKIAEKALPLFAGKRVRIVPHLDSAGAVARDTWARQLHEAGAEVSFFQLAGLTADDGSPAKDLNDCVTTRGFATHRDELAQLFS